MGWWAAGLVIFGWVDLGVCALPWLPVAMPSISLGGPAAIRLHSAAQLAWVAKWPSAGESTPQWKNPVGEATGDEIDASELAPTSR